MSQNTHLVIFIHLGLYFISPGLNQTLELSEMTRQQLEDEIMVLNREKADVTEQLT